MVIHPEIKTKNAIKYVSLYRGIQNTISVYLTKINKNRLFDCYIWCHCLYNMVTLSVHKSLWFRHLEKLEFLTPQRERSGIRQTCLLCK